MTRLLTTGFEVPNYNYPFTLSAGSAAISWDTTYKRSGAYALKVSTGGTTSRQVGMYLPANVTEVYVRFAFQHSSGSGTSRDFVRLHGDVSTNVFSINATNDTPFTVKVDNVVKITSSIAYHPGQWYLIEFRFKLHSVSGEVELRVNGVSEGTWSGNTNPDNNTRLKEFWIGSFTGNAGNCYFDDLAINDSSGSEDNSWCGDGYVVAMRPSGAGSSSQWTPVSTNNYEDVDEATPDNETTYVSTDVVNEVDLYALENPSLPYGATIKRVWVEGVARKATTDADNVQLGIKSGSTTSWSPTKTLSTSYEKYIGPEYLLNPDDSADWEGADLNSLEAGIKAV